MLVESGVAVWRDKDGGGVRTSLDDSSSSFSSKVGLCRWVPTMVVSSFWLFSVVGNLYGCGRKRKYLIHRLRSRNRHCRHIDLVLSRRASRGKSPQNPLSSAGSDPASVSRLTGRPCSLMCSR